MKKFILLSILLVFVIFTAGCTEGSKKNIADSQVPTKTADSQIPPNAGATGTEKQKSSADTQGIQETKDAVVEVTQLEQINTYLQNGPVLVKVGAEWCDECKELKPILNELAAEYEGKATIVSLDTDQSPKLADYFGVVNIPDSFVIMGTENEEYVYTKDNGEATKDRFKARILGFKNKEVFEKILDFALQEKI
jgi:thiol-disulfide isomerase/thioredoxin